MTPTTISVGFLLLLALDGSQFLVKVPPSPSSLRVEIYSKLKLVLKKLFESSLGDDPEQSNCC